MVDSQEKNFILKIEPREALHALHSNLKQCILKKPIKIFTTLRSYNKRHPFRSQEPEGENSIRTIGFAEPEFELGSSAH